MSNNEKMLQLQAKLAEINKIEAHLERLAEQQNQQQESIAELNDRLQNKYQWFKILDSKVSQLILGKYAAPRVSKVEEIKKDYLTTILELKDYERLSDILKFEEDILVNKVNRTEEYIKKLIKLIDVDDLEGKDHHSNVEAAVRNYLDVITASKTHIENTRECILESDLLIQNLSNLYHHIDQQIEKGDPYELSLIRYSIFSRDDELLLMIRRVDQLIDAFMKKLKEDIAIWINTQGIPVDFEDLIIMQALDPSAPGSKIIETLALESEALDVDTSYTLNQLKWLSSKLISEVTVLKNLLIYSLEKDEEDILNYKSMQFEMIRAASL